MLELHPADRDLTRFFWLRDVEKPPNPENLQIFRFCRVLFGAIASPFLLSSTIIHHLRHSKIARKYCELSSEIEKSIYMDNILILACNNDDAVQKIQNVREIFADAGMQLREFLANSEGALKGISPEDRIVPRSKFLGIDWSVESDIICFQFPFSSGPLWTMRTILRIIHSNFDPLGLTCPTTYRARLFFQTLWDKDKNLKWDTPIDEDAKVKWLSILHEWEGAKITVPRFTNIVDAQDIQVHIFTDASNDSYAASIFARITLNGAHHVHLLFAKNRLAPKNMKDKGRITIPKLELLGILIGTRAGNFVS